MKKIIIILAMFLVLGYRPLIIAGNNNLTVTYIGNEGFLVEGSGKKILIDALHGKGYVSESDVPSAETQVKLSKAQSPFDDIDLIFVTHKHQDHFDPSLVISHLINNKHCLMVGPQQVVDQLKYSINFRKVEKQIHAITPDFYNSEDMSLNGIEFSAIRFKHISKFFLDEQSGVLIDRHRNVQNLGFLISLGSHKILHIGDSDLRDAEEEYKHFQLAEKKIDIAFLTFWFMRFGDSEDSSVKVINDYIKPKRIILMHFDKSNFFQDVKYLVLRKMYQDKLAPVTIFNEELESTQFNN